MVDLTHDLAQARRIADDVAFFCAQQGSGRLVEHGDAARVLESARHELTAAYLNGARG